VEEVFNGSWRDPRDSDGDGLLVFVLVFSMLLLFAPFLLMGFSVCGCLGVLLFAFKYKADVTEKRPPLRDGAAQLPSGDFATGVFRCLDDSHTCLHAYCCTLCRAGDTYQGAGITQYWMVVGIFVVAHIIGRFVQTLVHVMTVEMFGGGGADPEHASQSLDPTPGAMIMIYFNLVSLLVASLIVGAVFQNYRRKLRVKLGGSEEGGPGVAVDFLMYAFCTQCVVAQEAREIDAATSVKVECCCSLTTAASAPLEGQPFVGQPQPLIGQPVYGNVA